MVLPLVVVSVAVAAGLGLFDLSSGEQACKKVISIAASRENNKNLFMLSMY
jgi:hypothetical protein